MKKMTIEQKETNFLNRVATSILEKVHLLGINREAHVALTRIPEGDTRQDAGLLDITITSGAMKYEYQASVCNILAKLRFAQTPDQFQNALRKNRYKAPKGMRQAAQTVKYVGYFTDSTFSELVRWEQASNDMLECKDFSEGCRVMDENRNIQFMKILSRKPGAGRKRKAA